MGKPVLVMEGLRNLFWDNEDLTLDEKAVLVALALVVDEEGTVLRRGMLRYGLWSPATINSAATRLVGEKRRSKVIRLLQGFLEKGYLEKVPGRYGYELRLTSKALAALGAVRETKKNVVDLAQLRRAVRADEG